MIGRLIERLFVQVKADLSTLSTELQEGVRATRAGTSQMAKEWGKVEGAIQRLHSEFKRGAVTQSQYMTQMNQMASTMSRQGMAYRTAQQQVWGYANSLKTVSRFSMPRIFNRKPVQQFTRSAGQARMQVMNLGFQLNDIGQTLATGMNPLTVMIQQGSQILQIYAGQGGLKTAFKDISRILGGLARRAWPIAVIAGLFKKLQNEINETSEVQVSFMDTVLATFQVMGRKVKALIAPIWGALVTLLTPVLNKIVEMVIYAGNGIINAFRSTVAAIKVAWKQLPKALADIMLMAANGVIHIVETQINRIVGLINSFVSGVGNLINKLPDWAKPEGGFSFGQIDKFDIPDIANPFAGEAGNFGAELKSEMDRIWSESPLTGLFDEIKDQAVQNALKRTADGIGGVGSAASKAADEVAELVEKMTEQVGKAADNLASVFSNAFEQIADTGKYTFSQLVMDLRTMVIKSTAQLLQQQISASISSMVMGTSGGATGFFAQLFTGLFGGRARGGMELPNRSFIAGEEGPELITPSGTGGARHVSTAGRTRYLMGQKERPMNVTFNIQTNDAQSFQKSQAQIASRMGSLLAKGRRIS